LRPLASRSLSLRPIPRSCSNTAPGGQPRPFPAPYLGRFALPHSSSTPFALVQEINRVHFWLPSAWTPYAPSPSPPLQAAPYCWLLPHPPILTLLIPINHLDEPCPCRIPSAAETPSLAGISPAPPVFYTYPDPLQKYTCNQHCRGLLEPLTHLPLLAAVILDPRTLALARFSARRPRRRILPTATRLLSIAHHLRRARRAAGSCSPRSFPLAWPRVFLPLNLSKTLCPPPFPVVHRFTSTSCHRASSSSWASSLMP
jgi:hypothetical protein